MLEFMTDSITAFEYKTHVNSSEVSTASLHGASTIGTNLTFSTACRLF
jgi:hypothetical protein